MPYWNWYESADKVNFVFDSSFFGSAPGTGGKSQVVDGRMGSWPQSLMNTSIWDSTYASFVTDSIYLGFNGDTTSGYFRNVDNKNKLLTRFGRMNSSDIPTPDSCVDTSYFPYINFYCCLQARFAS
jgi:hypothetical protein